MGGSTWPWRILGPVLGYDGKRSNTYAGVHYNVWDFYDLFKQNSFHFWLFFLWCFLEIMVPWLQNVCKLPLTLIKTTCSSCSVFLTQFLVSFTSTLDYFSSILRHCLSQTFVMLIPHFPFYHREFCIISHSFDRPGHFPAPSFHVGLWFLMSLNTWS